MTKTLVQELDELYYSYVEAINAAVEADRYDTADELAAAYDEDAVRLIAEREGLTHLLPLKRRAPESRLRRLVAALHLHRAA